MYDGTLHVGWISYMFAVKIVVIYIIYILYVCCEIYPHMSYIFVMKIVGFNKKQIKEPTWEALCRLPPTATGSLPSATDGKEDTWHLVVLPGS